jgi:hypothetical protein
MPVQALHPLYHKMQQSWEKIQDALDGQYAIQLRAQRYVPQLTDQTVVEYNSYRMRAVWFSATARTLEAWVGMICRKAAKIEIPDGNESFLESADLLGVPFVSYTEEVIRDLASFGRAGTWVDWSDTESRPYITHYSALQILNWRWDRQPGGSVKLGMVTLEETIYEAAEKDTEPTRNVQYRVLKIVDGVVVVELHTRAKESTEFALTQTTTPTRKGTALTEIPFVFHTLGVDASVPPPPPLLDMAEINFAHYRNSCDYENGLHIAGLPTPWAAGFTDDKTSTLTLGSTRAWVTDEVQAKCGFLEFTGSGLTPLLEAMNQKEKMMAALGSRVLEQKQGAGEALETVKLRAASETNSLSNVADAASRSCSLVVAWVAWWSGNAATVQELTKDLAFVQINKELVSSQAAPAQIQAWVAAFQAGTMSWDTFFFNMNRGEVYSEGWTLEEEKKSLEQTAPPPPRPAPGSEKPPGEEKP